MRYEETKYIGDNHETKEYEGTPEEIKALRKETSDEFNSKNTDERLSDVDSFVLEGFKDKFEDCERLYEAREYADLVQSYIEFSNHLKKKSSSYNKQNPHLYR